MLKKIEEKIEMNQKLENKFTYKSSGDRINKKIKNGIKPTLDHSLKLILNEEFKEEDLGKIWKRFSLMKLKQKIENYRNAESPLAFSKTISNNLDVEKKIDFRNLKIKKKLSEEKMRSEGINKSRIFKKNEEDLMEDQRSQNLIRKLFQRDHLSLVDFMHLPKSKITIFIIIFMKYFKSR
jgi:hypothetical protein